MSKCVQHIGIDVSTACISNYEAGQMAKIIKGSLVNSYSIT